MATAMWSYLQNPFDNVTKRNTKKMLLLATDHFDKLAGLAQTDAMIDTVYQQALPAFIEFKMLFRQTITNKATYQMHTQEVETMIQQLSSEKIRQWDVRIQVVMDERSPKYKSVLPDGRTPFQRGAYEVRINEVESLIDRLLPYTELHTLQQEIIVFAKTIKQARSEQQNVERLESELSQNLETARQTLAKKMHKIFGVLISYYEDNLSLVETLYELKYLRTTNSAALNTKEEDTHVRAVEEGEIPAKDKKAVFAGDIQPDDEILIENTGDTTLEVYSSDSTITNKPTRTLIVSPQQNGSFVAKDITTGSQEMIVILNAENKVGQYEIALLRYEEKKE